VFGPRASIPRPPIKKEEHMPRKPAERSVTITKVHNGFFLTLNVNGQKAKEAVALDDSLGQEILGLFEVKPRERKTRVVRKKAAAQEAAAG
jgi:hypothetical protein